MVINRSLSFLRKVGDEVVAVLGLLQATEGHLGTRNVLLGVLEVLELNKSQQSLHYASQA